MKLKWILLIIAIVILAATGVLFAVFNKKPQAAQTVLIPEKNIHMVFTADKDYKDYLKVALKSAVMNKNNDSVYDIRILCVDLTEEEMNEYKSFETENVTVTPILVELESIKDVGDYEVFNHVSRADLFKFFMPDILSDLDKVIYIDSDTLILKDLSGLYNIDLGDTYLGAVTKFSPEEKWIDLFGFGLWWIPRKNVYAYNCGVMLFNLKGMRENNIKDKLIKEKEDDEMRFLMTQDAYNNAIPIKTVTHLSPIYNVISRWNPEDYDKYKFKKVYAPYLDNINSLEELYKDAVIIHFAGYRKPWFYVDVPFSEEWRNYAKMVNKDWEFENIRIEKKHSIEPHSLENTF